MARADSRANTLSAICVSQGLPAHPREGGPVEITIWSGNLKQQVYDAANSKGCAPRHFEMPDIKVQIFLNDVQGALQKALMQDPLLKGRMMEAGGSVVGDMAQLMAYWVCMAETEITKIAENTALTVSAKQTQIQTILGKLPNNLAQTKQQIQPKVQAAAMREWQELCRSRSEYRKYLIQAGLNIAAGSAKVIFTTIATVGTAGGALALGIFGVVSGAAGIAGELYNLGKEAEKVESEVFKSVVATLKKKGRTSNWGKIITSAETIARKLAPTDLVVDTPVKCKELNERYEHKLQGLDTKSHDLATKLNTALEKSDELETVLKQEENKRMVAVAAATPRPDPSGRRGAMSLGNLPNAQGTEQAKALEELRTVIQGRIEEVQKLSQRVNTGKKLHAAYGGFIEDMIRERVPPFMPQIAEGISFAADVFSLKWQDVVRDASINLAKTFGPEVVNQSVEMFQKAREKYASA